MNLMRIERVRETDMAGQLPTFEDMRCRGYQMLGDVEDELRSDWRPGSGPSRAQAVALNEARSHIAHAKAALSKAGR